MAHAHLQSGLEENRHFLASGKLPLVTLSQLFSINYFKIPGTKLGGKWLPSCPPPSKEMKEIVPLMQVLLTLPLGCGVEGQ